MHRHLLRKSVLVAMMASAGVLTSVAIAQKPATGPNWVHAQARDTAPDSRIEGDQSMDAAVAAAVIGAVATEFGERKVEVRLDEVAVMPASIRDRTITGEGRLRIGASTTARLPSSVRRISFVIDSGFSLRTTTAQSGHHVSPQ